jgi:diadenosine tetraphosphatase ApaH/serine/threonine PP2A family protein phosphatase
LPALAHAHPHAGLHKYSTTVYNTCIESFAALPVAGLLDGKFFCVHGGISPELNTLADIDRVRLSLSRYRTLTLTLTPTPFPPS